MKNTYYTRINSALANIRKILVDHITEVDRTCEQTKSRLEDAEQKFNPQALAEATADIRRDAKTTVASSASVALGQIAFEFDDITATLAEWIAEPVPESFISITGALNSAGAFPTQSEIEMLSQLSSGNYFAEKILHQMAEQQGMHFPHVSLDEINRAMNTAKADVESVINTYAGSDSSMLWITELNDHSLYENPMMAGIALNYMERDDSTLSRFEETIRTATDNTVTLIKTEQDIIAELFSGCSDDTAKTERMKTLILAKPELEPRLSIYDKNIFDRAKRQILEMHLMEQETAQDALKQAMENARQIAQKVKKEKTEQTIRDIKASESNNASARMR